MPTLGLVKIIACFTVGQKSTLIVRFVFPYSAQRPNLVLIMVNDNGGREERSETLGTRLKAKMLQDRAINVEKTTIHAL